MVIQLGDKVKDKITGFIGIAIAKTEYLNGCIQYMVIPKMKRGVDKLPEEVGIDEEQLEVIEKKIKIKKTSTGGAYKRFVR